MSWIITLPVTTVTAAPVTAAAVNLLRPRATRGRLYRVALVLAITTAAARLGFPLGGFTADDLLPLMTDRALTGTTATASTAWLAALAFRNRRLPRRLLAQMK